MKYLNMQERVDFVNAVVDNATQDGVYVPALLDIYFRIQVLIDICGVDFDEVKPEDYARIAYEDFFEKYDMDDTSDEQLTGLKDACKVEAKLRHEKLIAYMLLNKKSSADDLFTALAEYIGKASDNMDGINLNELVAALGKFDKVDNNAIAEAMLKKMYEGKNAEEVDMDGPEKQTDLPV